MCTCACDCICPSGIANRCCYFYGEEPLGDPNFTKVLPWDDEASLFSWEHAEVLELHQRRYMLKSNALEIFLSTGRTVLLAFDSTKVGGGAAHTCTTSHHTHPHITHVHITHTHPHITHVHITHTHRYHTSHIHIAHITHTHITYMHISHTCTHITHHIIHHALYTIWT